MHTYAVRQRQPEQDHKSQPARPQQRAALGSKAPAGLQWWQQAVGNTATTKLVKAGLRTPGVQLAPELRAPMEARFGENFGDVRLHSDPEAAQALDARAFTTGHDIVVGDAGALAANTAGQQLLAHELAHVVQQRRNPGAAGGSRVSRPGDSAEREAVTVAQTVARGGRAPAITAAGHGIQRDVGWARRGPLPDPYGQLFLLNAFAGKFPEAAKLIHKNPAAMKLVDEAEAAGVQFGGYVEEGPAKTIGRPYTVGTSVYVPKTSTDPMLAMNGFLFELNNALRAPKFAALTQEAVKGSKGTLSAKDYAYKMAEKEVEGMLRLGEIWFDTKKTMPKGAKTNAYDAPFYLPDFEAVKNGKKTKDDLVKDVLKRVYDTGTLRGKTVEQYYMEFYGKVSGGK
jgi:hypothetical protein